MASDNLNLDATPKKLSAEDPEICKNHYSD